MPFEPKITSKRNPSPVAVIKPKMEGIDALRIRHLGDRGFEVYTSADEFSFEMAGNTERGASFSDRDRIRKLARNRLSSKRESASSVKIAYSFMKEMQSSQ